MQFLRSLIFTILLLFWLFIVIPYFFIQTETGAHYVSKIVTSYSDKYIVSVSKIEPSLAHPYQIKLNNLVVKDKHDVNKVLLSSESALLIINKNEPFQMQSFDYIRFTKGTLSVDDDSHFSANRLELNQMDISYKVDNLRTFFLQNVNGKMDHWASHFKLTPEDNNEFNFTVKQAQIDKTHFNDVYIKGFIKNERFYVTDFGANANESSLIASFNYKPNESLEINQLKIDRLNYETTAEVHLPDFMQSLNNIDLNHISILNSSFNSPNFRMTGVNLLLDKLKWEYNKLDLSTVKLSFNANNIHVYGEQFEKTLLDVSHTDQQLLINKFITSWRQGLFSLNGSYIYGQLSIDRVMGMNLNYSLPKHWREQLFTLPISDEIKTISLKQVILLSSTMSDESDDFAFKLQQFELSGHQLKIDNQDKKQTYQGNLSFKVQQGNLNGVEVKNLILRVLLNGRNQSVNGSMKVGKGILEVESELNQLNVQKISLTALSISSSILKLWQLINNPIVATFFSVNLQKNSENMDFNGDFTHQQKRYPVINTQLSLD